MNEKCEETGQRPLAKDERCACRWVTIAKYNKKGKFKGSTCVLLYRIRSLNPRLFSRATVVWDGYEEGTWKRVAVKDAWRQVARDREDVLYAQIDEYMKNRSWSDILDDYKFLHRNAEENDVPPFPFGTYKHDANAPDVFPAELEEILVEARLDPEIGELFGLARLTHGDDLGAREVDKAAPLERANRNEGTQPPHYAFYHRTVSSQNAQGRAPIESDDPGYNERSHMRLVFESVGRPLSQFRSTKECVKGLRDAIIGMFYSCCFSIAVLSVVW